MEPAHEEDDPLEAFPMTSSQRQHTPRTLQDDDVSEAATATVVQRAYRAANNASCGGRGSSFRAREARFPGFPGGGDWGSRSKIFNDPVHGHIRIPAYCVEVIDTAHFQRLRDLKQLGTIYFIYPGASHNRFEHSIGTAWIALDVIDRFARFPELGIERADKRAVALAGLCHDLGHGPFSHVFEHEFVPAISARKGVSADRVWRHEEMSEKIIDHLVDHGHIDESIISKRDFSNAKDLIAGRYYDVEKKFLADIVCNERNSIDVDKMDYIARDALNCGVNSGTDFKRIIEYMKVLDNQICFKASEIGNLCQLFSTRANLNNTVYTHKKGKAIEYMVVDALLAAEPVLNLTSKLDSAEDFLELDDTLLRRIEVSKDPRLGEAQGIIRRLRRREIYKHAGEFTIPNQYFQNYSKVTAKEILEHKRGDCELNESDICVHNLKIDWTNRENNPVKNVLFYHHYDDLTPTALDEDKYRCMLPASFMMRKLRIFSKRRDEETIKTVIETFERFIRHRFSVDQKDIDYTPQKPPRKRCKPSSKFEQARKGIQF